MAIITKKQVINESYQVPQIVGRIVRFSELRLGSVEPVSNRQYVKHMVMWSGAQAGLQESEKGNRRNKNRTFENKINKRNEMERPQWVVATTIGSDPATTTNMIKSEMIGRGGAYLFYWFLSTVIRICVLGAFSSSESPCRSCCLFAHLYIYIHFLQVRLSST